MTVSGSYGGDHHAKDDTIRKWGLGFTCNRKDLLSKELYTETLIRNAEKVGLFRLQVRFRVLLTDHTV